MELPQLPQDTPLSKHCMMLIGNEIPLKKAELNRYIEDHENHLITTAEILRGEMSGLAGYVDHAEKRLRKLIQLKVTADLKICRDIKMYGKFEVAQHREQQDS